MSSSNQANYLGSRSIRCLTDTSNSVKLSKQLLSFLYSNLILTKIVSFELSHLKVEYLCRFLAITIPKCKRSSLRSQCYKMRLFKQFSNTVISILGMPLASSKIHTQNDKLLGRKISIAKKLGEEFAKEKKNSKHSTKTN